MSSICFCVMPTKHSGRSRRLPWAVRSLSAPLLGTLVGVVSVEITVARNPNELGNFGSVVSYCLFSILM